MLKLLLEKKVVKYIHKLPPKHQKQVAKKIQELLEDPISNDSKILKKYKLWRADIGEYRIVYTFDKSVLHVIIVGKRNDSAVYKLLKRALG